MITLKTFIFNNFQVNTYVLQNESKQAIVVDPACSNIDECEELFEYINSENLTPVKIINTHCHIDHIIGVDSVRKKYNIPFLIHHEEEAVLDQALSSALMFGFSMTEVPRPDKYISDKDIVQFGGSDLELLHVPGHSPGSIVIHSEKEHFILAGDVLFNGSVGRTDLLGGNYEQLINGIKSKLMQLPKNTLVFCGHGPSTTIQKEHDSNPFLVQ